MHIAVLSGFVISLTAPALHRYTRAATGWILALLPIGLFAYFATFIAPIMAGDTFTVSYSWVPSLGVSLSFYLDGLSLLFALLVTGIGALVTIYAGGYLAGHDQLGRFYAYLILFMTSMVGVVLTGNLFGLFVFWELTSISSYLLIGFDHEREEARSASLQALLVTGGGGLAMLAGFVLLQQAAGSSELSVLSTQGEILRAHPRYLPILLLILLGAFTKSAQVPFHIWLPNAMEAPTPVSAYLHSATMVKAGIYLLARLSQALGGTETWLLLVGGIGLITTVVGAYLALNHSNLKRILAYSTISSLGTMVLLIGVGVGGAIQAAVVYLLAHALYKGALFMTAGAIYHETGTQDADELGGLRRKMPVMFLVTSLAALSLAGFGPLLSFIGKELTFEALLESPYFGPLFTFGAVVSAAASVAVALILVIRPFFSAPKTTPRPPHDPPLSLWLGPALLGLLGLIFGLLPASISGAIISPAAGAILGEPQIVYLSLWHGFNLALGLSAAAILLGLLLYRVWDAWRRGALWLERYFPWGPARGYDAVLSGVVRFAERLTGVLQSGHLNDYMITIILTTVALAGFTFLSQGGRYLLEAELDFGFYEILPPVMILAAVLVVVNATSRLVTVAALGVVGYGMALIFVLFGAPDLAMTQILVETITVILLVLILYHLPGFAQLSSPAARRRDALIALMAGALMTSLVLVAYGADHIPPISGYFLENSVSLAHGRNIVNVILVDFRALDTLGEITVLSLAGIGVFALLKLRRHTE